MRLPARDWTPVIDRLAVGIKAERASRTNSCACIARKLPTVICGFFCRAKASASRRVKLLPVAGAVVGACAGDGIGFCARQLPVETASKRRDSLSRRFMLVPPQPCLCGGLA